MFCFLHTHAFASPASALWLARIPISVCFNQSQRRNKLFKSNWPITAQIRCRGKNPKGTASYFSFFFLCLWRHLPARRHGGRERVSDVPSSCVWNIDRFIIWAELARFFMITCFKRWLVVLRRVWVLVLSQSDWVMLAKCLLRLAAGCFASWEKVHHIIILTVTWSDVYRLGA